MFADAVAFTKLFDLNTYTSIYGGEANHVGGRRGLEEELHT